MSTPFSVPVQGLFPEGNPASDENPVLVAGKDRAGDKQVPIFEEDGGPRWDIVRKANHVFTAERENFDFDCTGCGSVVFGVGLDGDSNPDAVAIVYPSNDGGLTFPTGQMAAYELTGNNWRGTPNHLPTATDMWVVPVGGLTHLRFMSFNLTAGRLSLTVTGVRGNNAVNVADNIQLAIFPAPIAKWEGGYGNTPGNIGGLGVADGEGFDGATPPVVLLAWDGHQTRVVRTPAVFRPLHAIDIDTEVPLWTPIAGKKFRYMGYALTSDIAGVIEIRDGLGGNVIDYIQVQADVHVISPPMGNGILSGGVDRPLTAKLVGAKLTGKVFGTEE